MRLRDYFVGIPAQLRSPLSPHTVTERINAASGSALWPFTTGVVGRIWLGRVRLRFRSSFAEYNAKPVLAGRLDAGPSGSILNLRYRAPAWIYLFDLLWYAILALVALLPLLGGTNPELTGLDFAGIYLGIAAMTVFPLGLHYLGTRNSDDELASLLEFLAEHADARPPAPL